MRKALSIFAISLILVSCSSNNYFSVDNSSSIIESGKLKESLGIETLGGVFTPIIQKGIAVPCEKSEIFSTASDNQTTLIINLFRGTNELTKDNKKIGSYQIFNIPKEPRGKPQIKVTFGINNNSIYLQTIDLKTNKSIPIKAINYSN